ncbi:MAG: beta-L-arabinofuranosidase domain-containing protein, partial [Planctomycetota bacterium]
MRVALWLLSLFPATGACQTTEWVIEPFNHRGVRLLSGMHLSQLQQVQTQYMQLEPNDVLRGFRLKHQPWAPGKDLGGAYSERPLSFGQWLAGLARLASSTGDPAIRQRALYLMYEWGKTISDDGSYGYEPGKGSHYDYDKMVGGLVDMHEFLGSNEALEYLDRITDWAERHLDRTNEYARPTEWYTLSENLFRAHLLTGEQRYLEFARVWEYDRFWTALAERQDIFQTLEAAERHPSFHAYSHVNSLSSAAMAYRVTGQPKYRDAILHGYEFLRDTQLYATGGYGPEESFVVPNGMPETLLGIRRGESNVDVRFHFETSCGSWAGFKLARYLMQFTGDAQYGDWMERLIYNGVGALP